MLLLLLCCIDVSCFPDFMLHSVQGAGHLTMCKHQGMLPGWPEPRLDPVYYRSQISQTLPSLLASPSLSLSTPLLLIQARLPYSPTPFSQ